EEVEVEVLAADLEVDPAADEGEAGAELEEEPLDLIDERLLDLSLAARIGGAEEVEEVRILEDLLGHVGVGRRQRPRERTDRLALPLVRMVLDLKHEHVARPTVQDSAPRVPEPRISSVEPLQERDVVVPGQLCKRRLHD